MDGSACLSQSENTLAEKPAVRGNTASAEPGGDLTIREALAKAMDPTPSGPRLYDPWAEPLPSAADLECFKPSAPFADKPADGDAVTSELDPIIKAFQLGRYVDIASLIVNDHGTVELLSESRSTGFRFDMRGVQIHVGIRTDGRYIRMTISGDLGYLPYSIEARDKRCAMTAVIAATHELRHCRFEVVDSRHILLRGHRSMSRPFQLADMFTTLIEMIHEISPFMDLLGECMEHPQIDIPVQGQADTINPAETPCEMEECRI